MIQAQARVAGLEAQMRQSLIVHPNGRATLVVGDNIMVRERFETICRGLAKAA